MVTSFALLHQVDPARVSTVSGATVSPSIIAAAVRTPPLGRQPLCRRPSSAASSAVRLAELVLLGPRSLSLLLMVLPAVYVFPAVVPWSSACLDVRLRRDPGCLLPC